MAEDAYAFVSGPVPVRQMTGVQVDVEELGGASVHSRDTGAASIVVPQDDVLPTISDILRFLPNHNSEEPPFQPTADPLDRAVPEALNLLPDTPTGSYDVRDVIRLVADDEEFLELRAGWAGNLVTGLSSIGGKPVGIVANQPMAIAGTLDIPASQKGARFVTMCDAFNLPIITFVDTPGLPRQRPGVAGHDPSWRPDGICVRPGYRSTNLRRVEEIIWGGIHRHGLQNHGERAYLAWPTAEIAVMGATRRANPSTRRIR